MKISQLDSLYSLVQQKKNIEIKIQKILGNGGVTPRTKTNGKPKAAKTALGNRALQGKYMGLVRHLTAEQKAEVKALKAAKGFRTALAHAKKLNSARTAAA